MIDTNTVAAKKFYKLVRAFAQKTNAWDIAVFYETLPDEKWDLTLVSRRVYDTPDEFLVIMAAAGLDRADMPLPQMRLVLPTLLKLMQLKRQAGFESDASQRDKFAPTWAK